MHNNARLDFRVLENEFELNIACLRTSRSLKFHARGGEVLNWKYC